MKNEIETFEALLNSFKNLPIPKELPTFMEICRFPGTRYEEICSRILKFYFDPNQPHGMKTLWLSSLCELLGISYTCVPTEQIQVRLEEKVRQEQHTSNKRLDIVIEFGNQIIGIENKITAALYNDLETYHNCITNRYSGKEVCMIVLSLYKLTDQMSVNKMRTNNFTNYTYQELFTKVIKNMGQYILHNNNVYTTYMFDFIQTLEHKGIMNLENERNFFISNHNCVKRIHDKFNDFKAVIFAEQKEQIANVRTHLQAASRVKWDVYQDWDLFTIFNGPDNDKKIGIECNYEIENGKSCGKFRIYITTWSREAWTIYERDVLDIFKNTEYIHLDKTVPNRVYLHMTPIENNISLIVETLQDISNKLGGVAEKYGEPNMQSFIPTSKLYKRDKNYQFPVEEMQFFLKYREDITSLDNRYQQFKESVFSEQKEQMSILLSKLTETNKNQGWFLWEGWDLVTDFNGPNDDNKIGIESNYEALNGDPCGEFHIYITTRTHEAWSLYKDKVCKDFDNCFIDEKPINNPNRVYLHLPVIFGNNHDAIIEYLNDVYLKMKNAVANKEII